MGVVAMSKAIWSEPEAAALLEAGQGREGSWYIEAS